MVSPTFSTCLLNLIFSKVLSRYLNSEKKIIKITSATEETIKNRELNIFLFKILNLVTHYFGSRVEDDFKKPTAGINKITFSTVSPGISLICPGSFIGSFIHI